MRHSSNLPLWSWKAGFTQAPQLHCIPAQLKEPKRALHPIHTSFSSTCPSCTAHQKEEMSWFLRRSSKINWKEDERKRGFDLLNLTGFHPFHWFNKYGGAISWLVLYSLWITTSLIPLEAWFTFSSFVGNDTLLRGNNSTTLLTTIHNLRIWDGFWTWVIFFTHVCSLTMMADKLVKD